MNLQDWTGRSETVEDIATATPHAAFRATLDWPATPGQERPAPGTPLPSLWHWLYFLPIHRQSDIGPDGHAKRGGFMHAYTNILAALMHRQQTGQGQRIDVSMLESLTEWMSYPLYYVSHPG
jgi:hydroxyacyl-ACP dehydratase HTD2-like protein with hotdog domain